MFRRAGPIPSWTLPGPGPITGNLRWGIRNGSWPGSPSLRPSAPLGLAGSWPCRLASPLPSRKCHNATPEKKILCETNPSETRALETQAPLDAWDRSSTGHVRDRFPTGHPVATHKEWRCVKTRAVRIFQRAASARAIHQGTPAPLRPRPRARPGTNAGHK